MQPAVLLIDIGGAYALSELHRGSGRKGRCVIYLSVAAPPTNYLHPAANGN